MRTIIVTGATGTIGRAVIKILSQHDGVAIRAATRHPEKVRAGVGAEQLTPIAFDWHAPHAAGDVTAPGGTMLVLPPAAHHPLPATTRLLDSAITTGVQHIVFLSTLGADFEPGFAFGRWALAGEQAVAAAGLPYTVLRPNSYMTNFLTMSRPGHDGALRLPWSDGTCSFIDPRDVAAAAAHVLLEPHGHDGETYELTGPEALNLHEIAAVLRATAGTGIRGHAAGNGPRCTVQLRHAAADGHRVPGTPPRDGQQQTGTSHQPPATGHRTSAPFLRRLRR
jgi:uncharacterized protein YbjT (DUF2867 family)